MDVLDPMQTLENEQKQTQVQILDQMSDLGPTPEEVVGLFLAASCSPPHVPYSPLPKEYI